jgi:hypothetical protein
MMNMSACRTSKMDMFELIYYPRNMPNIIFPLNQYVTKYMKKM